MTISIEDQRVIREAINLPNADFAKALLSAAEKYQLFTANDIALLADRQKSRENFASDYAMLRLINNPSELRAEIKDNSGRNRYYLDSYQFLGKIYVFTSQLYGYKGKGTHNDNRTPFYNWFLEKAGLSVKDKEEWWPAEGMYNPGISKEKWVELLNRSDVTGPIWGGILAMFYYCGGSATCTQLGQAFNRDPASIRASATQLAKKIHDITNCPLFYDNSKEKYWTILFQGRHAADEEEGSWVWKLRPELSDALEECNILKFLPKKEANSMPVKDVIDTIKKYISINGFTYPEGMIENFYLSLKSKPFVILAGTSGTGKTKLVSLFAEAIGAKMKLVPVRPDWSDSSDLFGHVDLSGKFVPGEIIDFVKEASENLNAPYFLCLDEMNLARVEYYLSDFLSIIETRKDADGEIVTNSLLAKEKYGVGNGAYEYYGDLYLPENLYIIGTVNMDETTFPFSKKVLDRANTIEFSYVDLAPDFTGSDESVECLDLDNSFLKTEYLKLAACNDEANFIEQICSELQDINKILQKANAHVGYRVRDEIVFYMLNNKKTDLLDRNDAMDNEIMQKILPRIQGSSSAVKEMLCDLFKIFCSDYTEQQTAGPNLFEQMQKAIDAGALYPESAKKVAFMVRRFDEDGFTSYWL